MTSIRTLSAAIGVVLSLNSALCRHGLAESQPGPMPRLNALTDLVKQAGQQGIIVGAQIAVGTANGAPLTQALGAIAPGSRRKVDDTTLFCIGSCSKPFSSVCILTLVDDGRLDLDTPVDHWVPTLAPGSEDPRSGRLPTLRELLAHRGGIYSQKEGPMTPDQKKAIRDFTLTLGESVELIARQPRIAAPGEKYAYSGAGYCVAGFVAEQAAQTPFEELLQTRLAEPLGLARTTFFPPPDNTNVAVPGQQGPRAQIVAQVGAPHLLKSQLRLPLIGGSLYSTATETAAFARLVLHRGRLGDKPVLSEAAWQELTRQQFDNQGYGLGWSLTIRNGQTTAMRHTGALLGYRSLIAVDLTTGQYAVVHWTLSDPTDARGEAFGGRLERAAFGDR